MFLAFSFKPCKKLGVVFGMDEVRVFTVDMKDVLQHAKNKPGNGKDFLERTETDFPW